MLLKEKIESALSKPYGFRYRCPTWNRNLFNKSTSDIQEYLLNRFQTTLNIEEYYGCMVLLYHSIPDKNLLIEFKDSRQYHTLVNSTLSETPKTMQKTPKNTQINAVNYVSMTKFVGE